MSVAIFWIYIWIITEWLVMIGSMLLVSFGKGRTRTELSFKYFIGITLHTY